MIFNIQKCSVHDGDGLRTIIFFKGCPMRCKWCANPESQSYKKEIMESPNRCIGCEECIKVCRAKAISKTESGMIINRNACVSCYSCVNICYADSKRIVGKEYSTEELFEEILKDAPFYSLYGGGVTFSGGEPLSHCKDLKPIAKMCKENQINVAIESCGYAEYEDFKGVLPFVDSMFLDIKHIDSKKHTELTGKGNELIFRNARLIAEHGIPVTVRTPIVPGLTDTFDNIGGIAKFISTVPNFNSYELLAYHSLGESKYAALGRPYELKRLEPPSTKEMRTLVKFANNILEPFGKKCFWNNNKEE